MWHYRWDSRNQLRVVDTPSGERWFYRYDPFGRRIGKRSEQTRDELCYQWDGDQIAEVRHYRDTQLISRRHWVHNGWELLVQQRQNTDGRWETDFVTSVHNGEPQAVFNPQGELRWQAPKSTLWGQRLGLAEDPIDPGLVFAGQHRDTESGLCYNRFRYYNPTGGCYVSPDPIGVRGGENLYAYVPNPNSWVDPLGLAGCSAYTGKLSARASEMKPLIKGSKEWNQAVKDAKLATANGEKFQVRVSSSSDAKVFLKETQGNMNRYKAHTQSGRADGVAKYPKGYEQHMAPEGGLGDIPHIKWYNNGTDGHIFYGIPN